MSKKRYWFIKYRYRIEGGTEWVHENSVLVDYHPVAWLSDRVSTNRYVLDFYHETSQEMYQLMVKAQKLNG